MPLAIILDLTFVLAERISSALKTAYCGVSVSFSSSDSLVTFSLILVSRCARSVVFGSKSTSHFSLTGLNKTAQPRNGKTEVYTICGNGWFRILKFIFYTRCKSSITAQTANVNFQPPKDIPKKDVS